MEDKKRGKPSARPNYWSIRDMIKYAAEKDSNVKLRLDSQVLLSDGITEGRAYYHTLEKRIKKIFKDYKIAQKIDESQKTSPYILGEPIARFVVDNLLLAEDSEEDSEDIEGIKKQFLESDETWTRHSEALYEVTLMNPDDPEMVKELQAIKQAFREEHPEEYDEYGNHKGTFEYHIPVAALSNPFQPAYGLTIIDRTMLRAIFFHFFEFKETEFREGLSEREALINTDWQPFKYKPGFSELTYKLENPLGYYIFPKNRKTSKKEPPKE